VFTLLDKLVSQSQWTENAGFDAKSQIIELLDNRGKIACENGQKVLYLGCLLDFQEQQQRSSYMGISVLSHMLNGKLRGFLQ
jgi:hypothetical protein